MPALKICRICMSSDVKLYKFDCYDLKTYYEEVIGTKVNAKDGLPQYFCYECAAVLYKCHKFKEKCYNGQKVIEELLQKGPISLKALRCIGRQNRQLTSSLNIITANRRVKTYIIKSKEEPKLDKTDSKVIDLETAPTSDDGDYNDANDEKEESPPSPSSVDDDKKIENVEDKIHGDEENTVADNIKVDIVQEKQFIKEEKISIDEENGKSIENLPETNFVEDEKLFTGEEIVFVDNVKIPTDNEKERKSSKVAVKQKKNVKGSNKKNKDNDKDTGRKAKKFEITNKKRTDLDPKNWLKYTLTEEEALKEFNARAQHKRFISAQYKCNKCLKAFSKEDMLNRHVKLRHSEFCVQFVNFEVENTEQCTNTNAGFAISHQKPRKRGRPNRLDISVGPIECRFCHMRFKQKCSLRQHMREHYSKFKCLRCDLVCPLETTALYHEDYHNGVTKKCELCDKEFKHQTTYYTHLRTHRSQHVCTLCGASFVSAAGLSMHKKYKHINMEAGGTQGPEDEGEYCKRCDIKFKTKKAFEEHLDHSAMHVDDAYEQLEPQTTQPLVPNMKKRRRHQTRFMGIPTDCNICGQHFPTQMACRKHHMAAHPRFSFFSEHERQVCEICGISLAPGSVASHLNTHTREKLYPCKTCGRVFNSNTGLSTHQLTHSSVKPVACSLCDKRFKQSSSMKLHYRTFHLKEPYPKRNRKKKSEEIAKLNYYSRDESEDDNMTLDKWRSS